MANNIEELYEKIKEILLKKAEGYFYDEEVYEYQRTPNDEQINKNKNEEKAVSCQLNFFDSDIKLKQATKKRNNSMQLTKKKVTTHHVPPDLSAIKMLYELYGNFKDENDLSKLTDKEIAALKKEIINNLNEEE